MQQVDMQRDLGQVLAAVHEGHQRPHGASLAEVARGSKRVHCGSLQPSLPVHHGRPNSNIRFAGAGFWGDVGAPIGQGMAGQRNGQSSRASVAVLSRSS
jgi:hypothetical protein